MNKKSITILGIAILVILTGSFWFFQKNTNNSISTNTKIYQEDNTEIIDGSIIEVKNDNQEKKNQLKILKNWILIKLIHQIGKLIEMRNMGLRLSIQRAGELVKLKVVV